MANNCITTYKISGTEKAVKDLWKKLQDREVNSRDVYLWHLAEDYGIDCEKKCISARGYIYFAELETDEDNDYYFMQIETDTAWTGCHDLFHAINHTLDDELSISYREVECGCDIYCIHDEGDYFDEECCVSCYGGPFEDMDGEMYTSVEEGIEIWCSAMNITQGERTNEEMMKFINEYEYEFNDIYYYIHPFTYE